jgi:hypothetical protein
MLLSLGFRLDDFIFRFPTFSASEARRAIPNRAA